MSADTIAFYISLEEIPDHVRVMCVLDVVKFQELIASHSEVTRTRVGQNGLRLPGGI
jgi:hypothetical protein